MRFILSFIIMLMIESSALFTIANADDKKDLQTIRASIIEQEKKLAEQKQQRTKLMQALQKQETAIANLLNSLEKHDKTLKTLEAEIARLMPQINDLQAKQTLQQKILAKQLESAFKLGKTSSMELIFSGDESERNERMIAYYGYINKERQQQIYELREIKAELDNKKSSLEDKKQQQKIMLDKQKQERDRLVKNQQQRQTTIKSLESSMKLNQQKLADLKENEIKLQAQIVKAEKDNKKIAEDEARKAAQIQAKQQNYNYSPTKDERALMARVSGIGKPKRALSWPVNGTPLHYFGQVQQGELRWKGLVIQAKEGAPVQAIADGRVILASWLQGYGFIVALDHGKGDMTLYGYNQRLLVEVGDNVIRGQNIALVGSSGGQGKPSLYFEIRRDGKALDPSAWLKK